MERRQGAGTTTAGPCIKLLQERFRQLKREREEREENLSARKRLSSPTLFKENISESTVFFATNEMALATSTSTNDSLLLGISNLSSKHVDYIDIRNQVVWKNDKRVVNTSSHKFQPHDLDTSLHL